MRTKTKPKQKLEKHEPFARHLGYWEVQKNAFIDSFRNIGKKTFLQCALFDLLALLSLFLILILSLSIINFMSQPLVPQLTQIYGLRESGDTAAVEDALVEYAPELNKLLWLSLLVVIVAGLLSLFFISVFYTKAWALAKHKELSSRSVGKSFIINFSWVLFWLFILLLTALIFKPEAAAFVILLEMLLFFYLDPALRSVFDENKGLWHNIVSFAKIAVRFHWFIFFLLSSFVFIILLVLLMSIFMYYPVVLAFLLLVFILLVLGWARNYVISIVRQIS